MRYKFIGTEEDLINNGYSVENKYNNKFAYNGNHTRSLFISLNEESEYNIISYNHFNMRYRQWKVDKKDIKDLIDKGLVEEV